MKTKLFALSLVTGFFAGGSLIAQTGGATIGITSSNNTVVLQWNNTSTLQMANSVNGPWVSVTNGITQTSSTVAPISGPAAFYRTVGTNGIASAAQPVLPNNLTQPLQVTEGTLQLLPSPVAAGNSRMVLTMAPGTVSSSNLITLLVGNTLTTLRDDGVFPDLVAGDGNFSAVVNMTEATLNQLNASITNSQGSNGTPAMTQVFSARSIVGSNVLQAFPTSSFLAGQAVPFFEPGGPTPIFTCAGSATAYNPAKTLMITDLSVVNDPLRTWDPANPGVGTKMGVWTFGALISNIANVSVTGPAVGDPSMTVSDFVLEWLGSYAVNQSINGDTVPAVSQIQSEIIAPWMAASQAAGAAPGTLDMAIAPFRLLAIVNRLDLRANSTYGGVNPNSPVPQEIAGEARFVFCALNSANGFAPFEPGMTVILEYAVPNIVTCEQVQNWAAQWANLNTLALPSAAYNNALQAITTQFSGINANMAQFPNHCALAQARVNDFLGSQWELRQFNIPDGTIAPAGWLVESPVAATPTATLNETCALESFINGTAGANPATTFCAPNTVFPAITIPTTYSAATCSPVFNQFLGGWAPEGTSPSFFFASSTPSALTGDQLCVRHVLSLNSCNACHTRETGTTFVHVAPRAYGAAAVLSGFLTGITVSDPYSGAVGPYTYSDLARRVQDLNSTVICPCAFTAAFTPLPFVE